VAPGVRRVTAPNAGPFTFAGTNSYILGSGRRVAIIDPGPRRIHFQALMAATAGQTLTHILVTMLTMTTATAWRALPQRPVRAPMASDAMSVRTGRHAASG